MVGMVGGGEQCCEEGEAAHQVGERLTREAYRGFPIAITYYYQKIDFYEIKGMLSP